MSTVRILCPGPSLARYDPIDFAGLVIAVNRAAVAFYCHCWAVADYPVIRDYHAKVLGTPTILTRRQTWTDIGHRVRMTAKIIEDIDLPGAPPWNLKTMTCAMAYAYATGAKRIELHGCDWEGTADYDGVQAGEDRTDKRWEQERAAVNNLSEWMRARGTEVVRV